VFNVLLQTMMQPCSTYREPDDLSLDVQQWLPMTCKMQMHQYKECHMALQKIRVAVCRPTQCERTAVRQMSTVEFAYSVFR